MLGADIRRKKDVLETEGYRPSWIRVVLSDGTSANAIYRLTCLFMRLRLWPVALILIWLNRLVNGCVIGANARFGPGFVLMHPVGVVINSKVKGGQNVVLESGVVIGDEKGAAPVLGSNVFVGAGAKIIGGVTIGDNVKIGANAVVVKDVPSNVTAVGIPARPIQRGVE